MSILVIDVGTSGLRAAVVDSGGEIRHVEHRPLPPSTPFPGLVEFDAAAMAEAVLEVAQLTLDRGGPVAAVGIANQRASVVVWDRADGTPIGPGLGWQDLRTVGECLTLAAQHGIRVTPNQSATKVAWLLNTFDPERRRDLCFGTVDSWVEWTISEGASHVSDHTNAGLTGLYDADTHRWSDRTLEALQIPSSMMPTLVDSSGSYARATALAGSPPIASRVGDQQGSLVGQGCIEPGLAKLTLGTGGMLDICTGPERPAATVRSAHGTFPIAAWAMGGQITWGAEGIMLSAATNIEWLVDDLGLLDSPAQSHEVAASCADTGGVVYVPALLGLGTPQWDFGARGSFYGLTRGTGRAELVRAVLEGVAHRSADLVEAAEADTGLSIGELRVDGGMSANPTMLQALADATQRRVLVSPVADATTLGAAFLAGVAAGVWDGLPDATATWRPARVVEPGAPLDREQWRRAVARTEQWIPELSALDF